MRTQEVFDRHRLDMKRRGLRPSSIDKRFEVLGLWRRWLEAHGRPVFEASEDDVQEWLDSRRLTDKTRHCYLSHVSSFYRWARREGFTAVDPTDRIVRPKLRRHLPRPCTDRDLAVALERADPRTRAMLALMAYGGLRCIEVANLDVDDVLEDEGLVRVRGKGDHERVVPLHPAAALALRQWGPPRSGPVFRSKVTGGRYTPARISQMTAEYLASVGVPATAHQLRHWFGTRVCETQGIRVTQELLGHQSPTTTAIYTRVNPAQLRAAVDSLPEMPLFAVNAQVTSPAGLSEGREIA